MTWHCLHEHPTQGHDGVIRCLCGAERRWWLGPQWGDPLHSEPVEPVDTHVSEALVHGMLVRVVDPVYPLPEADIRTARKARGLTLRAAAAHLGISPSELSALEVGSRRPLRGWADLMLRIGEAM